MRLYIIGGIVAALIAGGAWLYWQGKRSGELDRARDQLETRERQDEAAACDPDAHFLERLRNC